ncbi:MAG: ATP-binding protein [Candidatus Latescibacteria bacterium]|nr:ATP-binding protein [Candidatus Latescibacterota bacterium]
MIIAVASGKGGTGKTTVVTNLAWVLQSEGVTLLDCDVEEPNSALFLGPKWEESSSFRQFVPEVDLEKCTYCGRCSELCQFGAIITVKENILVFPELCHSCLGCKRICPVDAIGDGERELGTVSVGRVGGIRFVQGELRIGEAQAPPLIREVKLRGIVPARKNVVLIDSPPGTSCPVIEAVKGSDLVVLVTEPTPFGLHDLKLAVEMVRTLKLRCGLVINRSTIGDRKVWSYCQEENIPILLEIADDRRIAEVYSRGELVVEALPEYRKAFKQLYQQILTLTKRN